MDIIYLNKVNIYVIHKKQNNDKISVWYKTKLKGKKKERKKQIQPSKQNKNESILYFTYNLVCTNETFQYGS